VLAAVLDTLLRLLHPVIPFITEALWQALVNGETGEQSLVIADWPTASGDGMDSVATQRITDMQKLVTEVRRFRSDQGLVDRQKVPARLTGVADADLSGQVGAATSLAWLTAPGPDFRPSASLEVRLGSKINRTVVVELDTSSTIDVAAERRRLEKTWPQRKRNWHRPPQSWATRIFWPKPGRRRRQDPGPPAGGSGGIRPDQRQAGWAAMSFDFPDWSDELDLNGHDGVATSAPHRTRSPPCYRSSICWTNAGRRPASSRASSGSAR